MHKLLAVILGVFAFLAVCVYWLVQMATGEPALPLEDVALRALLAMLVAWAVGLLLGRLGVAVISTPKGLMTDKQARLARMGGEVLCEVW